MSGRTEATGGAEVRAREVVTGVIAEALRAREARRVILGAPPSAERDLLVGWLRTAGVPCAVPDHALVSRVAASLGDTSGSDPDGPPLRPEAFPELAAFVVACAMAVPAGCLVAGVETRTHLLLDGARAAILPLGDLPASVVRDWAGSVRTPAFLEPFAGGAALEAVDRALASFLDEGSALARALEPLPPALGHAMERILRRGAPDARGPLVPKLGRWTPGLDLAL